MTTSEPRFWAVMIIGPPGAGKDTQAELLSEELGLVHIQTSKLIEAKFAEPNITDPRVVGEKKKFEAGELTDSQFVLDLIIEKIEDVQKEHLGIVFSGSPRKLMEAEAEIPKLAEFYGKEHVKILSLQVGDAECINRNSHRRICTANRHPIPNLPEYKNITACPKDGSQIVTRTLDAVETIKKRLEVYRAETLPVLDYARSQGYNIIEINGEQSIEDVHRDILNKLW